MTFTHVVPSFAVTCVCVSGGKKCLFFGNFGVLYFLETPLLRFALLPYYRRVMTCWGTVTLASSCVVLIPWLNVLNPRCTCTVHSLWDVITSFFSQGGFAKTLSNPSAINSMSCFFVSVEWTVTYFGGSRVDKDKLCERWALHVYTALRERGG